MTKKLYRFYWNCGRSGDLEGLFVAETEDVNKVVGKEVYFGEVLGKHSEIYGTLEESDLKIIDIPETALEVLVSELGTTFSGYNPIAYYFDRLEELGEEDEDDE